MTLTIQQNEMQTSADGADKQSNLASFNEFCLGKTAYPDSPLIAFIEVAQACNLRCTMCGSHSQHSKRPNARGFFNEAFLDDAKELAKRAFILHLYGRGEPLLNPHFPKMIEGFSQGDTFLDFFTNGMLFNSRFSHLVVDNHVGQVTFSLSFSNKQDYEKAYFGSSWDKVIGNITYLADLKKKRGLEYPIIEVNSIGFKKHIEELPFFIMLMSKIGVNVVHVKPLLILEGFEHLESQKGFFDSEAREKIREAHKIAKSVNVILSTNAFEGPAYSPQINNDIASEVVDVKKFPLTGADQTESLSICKAPESFHGCLEPFKTVFITADGDTYPCCFTRSFSMGQMQGASLQDIWNGEAYNVLRQSLLNNSYPKEICELCMKRKSYPTEHYFNVAYGTYMHWYASKYNLDKKDLPPTPALPTTGDIIGAHCAKERQAANTSRHRERC